MCIYKIIVFFHVRTYALFHQVARALRYMHSMKIVHRDVKPENVMIMDRPSPDEDKLYPEVSTVWV